MKRSRSMGLEREADRSFETVVRRYEAPIGRYLYGLVGEVEQARDLSQETFLSAYRAWNPDAIDNPSAWLYRIATNKAMSYFRRRRLVNWVRLDRLLDLGRDPNVEGHGDRVATQHSVQQALNKLEPQQRVSLLLKAAGFSSEEIGEQLGCSPGAARTRLSRARETFRKHYRGWHETEGR
jgi:RNA polymerase sigma-70 factor, ECF subfamily